MRQTNPSCTSGPTFGWHRKFLWNITFQSCPNFFGFASTNSPSLIPKVANIHTTGLIWSQYLKSQSVSNLRDEWSLKSGWIFRKNSKGRGGVESFSIQQIPLQIFAILDGNLVTNFQAKSNEFLKKVYGFFPTIIQIWDSVPYKLLQCTCSLRG